MVAKTFGERLKAARESAGMSQGELERQLGLKSRGYVSMLEGGSRGKKPTEEFVTNVARVLGVPRGALVDEDAAPPTPRPRARPGEVELEDQFPTRAQFIAMNRDLLDDGMIAALRLVRLDTGTDPGIEFWHKEYLRLLRERKAFRAALRAVEDD